MKPEHDCRWCEGEGLLTLWSCTGPDMEADDVTCPECDDGKVCADVSWEQHDMRADYIETIYDRVADRLNG